jgi:hypothetical protein
MARRGCKCRDGSYRVKCCTSTSGSISKRSSTKSRRSNKKQRRRNGGRDGHPLEVTLDRLERRGKRYAYGSIIAGGLYGAALVAEASGEAYGDVAAYGAKHKVRSAPKPIRAKVARRYARRQAIGRTAYAAGKITSRVVVRGVPVIGTALLAYDLYTVADWALAKGRLPYGARDRR